MIYKAKLFKYSNLMQKELKQRKQNIKQTSDKESELYRKQKPFLIKDDFQNFIIASLNNFTGLSIFYITLIN